MKESLALFQRLSAHGHELDAELRRLEGEPDRATLSARLPDLRERTERITSSADSLRWATRDRARRFADDDLDSLSAQIDMEARPAPLDHLRPAAYRAPRWPEAPAADAAGPGQTWPDTARQEAEQQQGDGERPAIAPAAPRPTHPWQKKPRPESTT